MAVWSERDVYRVAIASELSTTTIRRFFRGEKIRDLTLRRIKRAARELGLPPPVATQTAPSAPTLGEVALNLEAKRRG